MRTLGHCLRDARRLRDIFREVCATDISRRFLARVVVRGRVAFDDLPLPVLREYAIVGGTCGGDPSSGLLRRCGLLFIGTWDDRPAVYVPEGVRRPYAEALTALLDEPSDSEARGLRRDLEALVARIPPHGVVTPPGPPSPRARMRLSTPGPDRVLEIDVRLFDLPVLVRRRLLVSYRRSLGALHEILRIAFEWPTAGRHSFVQPESQTLWAPPRRRVGRSATLDEWKATVRDALAKPGARALYVIDPPTHWAHEITTRAVHAPELVLSEPRVIEAEGVRPPVDFENKSGYASFLESWRSGRRGAWDLEIAGPDFDPDKAVDVDGINQRLSRFA